MNLNGLGRFLDAQNQVYLKALSEIKNGKKDSHWMWYIFPQLKGLGRSETADFYGIENKQEAVSYLKHPVLGKHLLEITKALLDIDGKTAAQIFGTPDDLKLKSCMTLFANIDGAPGVFEEVLVKYFKGEQDKITIGML